MDILLIIIGVILGMYCLVAYFVGGLVFAKVVKDLGGIWLIDVTSLDFWGMVGLLIVAPISIPIILFNRTG